MERYVFNGGHPDFLVCNLSYVYWQKGNRFRTSVIKKQNIIVIVIILLLVGVKWNDLLLNGGHFELSNSATPLRLWFPAEPSSAGKNCKYAKCHVCRKMCTFFPLGDPLLCIDDTLLYDRSDQHQFCVVT